MSEVFWEGIDHFVSARGRLLLSLVPQDYMVLRATNFRNAIGDKGAAVQNCIGFVDGIVVAPARQKCYMQQLVVYIGYKRKHALKFQVINKSDGMILHAYGPIKARRHNWYLYHCSAMKSNLHQILLIDGVQYVLYCDSVHN